MKVPPAGIEYVKVLLMSPFNFMAMACLSIRIENVNAAAGGRRACIDEHQLCRPSSAHRKPWQNDRIRAADGTGG